MNQTITGILAATAALGFHGSPQKTGMAVIARQGKPIVPPTYCKCGRRISRNKKSCLACAGGVK